jgi:serine/threonine-protein kinase RsbW
MIAYRERDSAIYASSPTICELSDLASGTDAEWFEKLVRSCDIESPARNDRSFIRSCLSAPMRVAANGSRLFVLLDDIHETVGLDDTELLLAELADVFSRSRVPFVVAGRRRFSLDGMRVRSMDLDDLHGQAAADLVEQTAEKYLVGINDQTRDLVSNQTGGRIGRINSLFTAAAAAKRPLDTFQHVEQVYAETILRGELGGFYRDVINDAIASSAARPTLLRLLNDGLANDRSRNNLDAWQRALKLDDAAFAWLTQTLDLAEVISVDGSIIRVNADDHIIADTIRSRFRIEFEREPRAVVAGEILANAMKRAPRIMARLYRREASIGLAELLSAFDFQEVPRAIIEYGRFRSELKGLPLAEIDTRLAAENDRIMLPQIVHTAAASEYSSELAGVLERGRAIVAIGFTDQNYSDSAQVAWLAAEIDSKLEADRETAELWCTRLKSIADEKGLANHRIWLVASEGFSDGALDVLAQYNAIGSSRRQASLLRDLLGARPQTAETEGIEYEMVIPVGEDTELIAAHALEEIARRHKFPAKAINQLKTALVEACINAAEHGLAPDRKIHQRFLVSDDKITISISNRGLRLTDKLADSGQAPTPVEVESPDTRRGWGLNLIRGLMDDVRVEPVDDGTRITMTKFLREGARV